MLVKELIASFGFALDESSLAKVDSAISNLGGKLKVLGAGLLAFSAVKMGFHLAEQMAVEGEVIEETAARLNMTEEAYQKLIAAGQLAGLSTNAIAGKLMYFNRSLAMAAEGGGRGAEKLHKLGIGFKNADGTMRDSNEVLSEVSDRIKSTTSQSEKLALVTGLFGRGGAAMLRFLSLGGNEIKRLGEEAQATGGLMDEKLLDTIQRNEVSTAKYHLAVKGLRNTLVNYLLPAIGWIYDRGKNLADGMHWIATQTNLFEAAAAILATATLVTLISRLKDVARLGALLFGSWKLNLIALGVAVVVLLVDDLITLFTGGKSAIGEVMDKLFGFGTAAQYVAILKEEWKILVEFFTESLPYIGGLLVDNLLHPLDLVAKVADGIRGAMAGVYRAVGMTKLADAMDKQIEGAEASRESARGAENNPEPLVRRPFSLFDAQPSLPFAPLASPTAGRPTAGLASGRAESPGLLAGLANESTPGFGRVPQAIPVPTQVHTTTVSAPNHVNLNVHVAGGPIGRTQADDIKKIVEGVLLKNTENTRRALRTTATP